ncbi:MAG: hypothetical protein Q9218_002819 [Villophora microphyllina]
MASSTDFQTSPAKPFSFAVLYHDLGRRGGDYHYHFTSIAEPSYKERLFFRDLIDILEGIEDRLEKAEAATKSNKPSSEVSYPTVNRTHIFAELATMQEEAERLGKDIELNQVRMKRGDPKAVEEKVLDATRSKRYWEWKGTLERIAEEVRPQKTTPVAPETRVNPEEDLV